MQRQLYIDEAHMALDIFLYRFRDSALPYTAVVVIFFYHFEIDILHMKEKVRAERLSYINFMEKKKNEFYLVHLPKFDK